MARLNLIAKGKEAPRLPLKISDRCELEQSQELASVAWLLPFLCIQSKSGCFSMDEDFAISKVGCQAETLLVAIGQQSETCDNAAMGRVPSRRRRENPRSYVREWIRAFGLKPADVARDADVNEGYLSQLISGAKTNPSAAFLNDLAGAMPQPFHYTQFYKPPPDEAAVRALSSIDPALLPHLKPRH